LRKHIGFCLRGRRMNGVFRRYGWLKLVEFKVNAGASGIVVSWTVCARKMPGIDISSTPTVNVVNKTSRK
jgi:hypothetical protein